MASQKEKNMRGLRCVTPATQGSGVSVGTLSALMLAVFVVSAGYGILLPLLPYLVERLLAASVEPAQVSRHTGLLTGVYTLALFLFAPAWGRLSDRLGRRTVLLVGLGGFGISMLGFSFVENFTAVYAERFLSGMFASAVTPIAAATIGDLATRETRGRRLAFVSMAGIAGFVVGPILGVLITRVVTSLSSITTPLGSIAIPLGATALLAFFTALTVAFAIPQARGEDQSMREEVATVDETTVVVPRLLVLTFIVSIGIGVFEVGLALRGKQVLGLTPYEIAFMFTECSVVMFVAQGVVFSPLVRPETTRWLIAPALSVLAAALFLVPRMSDFALMVTIIGAVASSAGILSPILTYWISTKAAGAQGWQLGKQTAAASLGVTFGSAAGGLLFNIASFPDAPFVLGAAVIALGFLLSVRLPHLLKPGYSRGGAVTTRSA